MEIKKVGKMLLDSIDTNNKFIFLPIPVKLNDQIMDAFMMFTYEEHYNELSLSKFNIALHENEKFSYTKVLSIDNDRVVHISAAKKYFKDFNKNNFERFLFLYDNLKDKFFAKNESLTSDEKTEIKEYYDLLKQMLGELIWPYYVTIFGESFDWMAKLIKK